MSISIKRRTFSLAFKSFVFPGGEIGVKLDQHVGIWMIDGPFVLTARLQNAHDIIELAMVQDAIKRREPDAVFHLFMPYLPYARQDRVCDRGEAFSLKVFGDLINSLAFDRVTVLDPHSDVAAAVIDNLRAVSQLDILTSHCPNALTLHSKLLTGITLVAPDAGSNKKVSAIAKYYNHAEFIRADKLRDMATGNIKETIVYADDLTGRDVAIVDDLCDGGRTFIELAKVLKAKGARWVMLYVTHGIFSKNIQCLFEGGINEVWTTNAFRDDLTSSQDFRVIDIGGFA